MHSKKTIAVLGTVILALMIGLVGCSGDDKVIVTKAVDDINIDDEVLPEPNYFPLDEGYTGTYKISSTLADPEFVTYEVGAEVAFGGQTAFEWFSYDSRGTDTAYIVVAVDGIDYYSSVTSRAERILQFPLEVGSYWERYADLGTGGSDGGGFGDDLGGDDKSEGPDDQNEGGIVLGKNLPLSGDATMNVTAIQSIQLGDGQSYANAYLIQNDLGDSRENRYWYVENVGLVKFEIGVQTEGGTSTLGELVSYGLPR
ncbi:MAG: hypothetical protein P1R58_04950 [bacterium]|nr:hypothetical protein [bacterium]